MHQEQDIQHAPSSAVTVAERVHGLELVMLDGQSNQRINVTFGVDEVLPILELVANQIFALGRRIYDFPRNVVTKIGAGLVSEI